MIELMESPDGAVLLDVRRWISPPGREPLPTRRGARVQLTPAIVEAFANALAAIGATDSAQAD